MNKKNATVNNKGTGAGGANTNATGLCFEDKACLDKFYSGYQCYSIGKQITFNRSDKKFLNLRKKEFVKWTNTLGSEYNDIPKLSGTKEPDECYINLCEKVIIILEKKFQQGGGSVVEKLQTPVNKIRNLKKRYPTYNVYYIYWLSEWFEKNAQAEILDLIEDKIPYFIGTSDDTMLKIVTQIVNY